MRSLQRRKEATPLNDHPRQFAAYRTCAVHAPATAARRWVVWMTLMLAASITSWVSAAEVVQLTGEDAASPVVVTADAGNQWREGSYEVWILRGNCEVRQGAGITRCREGVLWIDRLETRVGRLCQVTAYLEGDVVVQGQALSDPFWLGRFDGGSEVEVYVKAAAGKPDVAPDILRRAVACRDTPPAGAIQRTQFTEFTDSSVPAESLPLGARRVRAYSRGDTPVQVVWFHDPPTNQWIAVIDSGVNLIVDGLRELESIDVTADRLVLWTSGLELPDLSQETVQAEAIPLELYMEGNIVFRQGNRVIHAERMYYDVNNQVGTVLGAKMLTPVPRYDGMLRVESQVIYQTGPGRFFARDSFITSSRMGAPRYRIEAQDIEFQDLQFPVIDPLTGQAVVDPLTQEPLIDHQQTLTGRNALVRVGEVPIFYWPYLRTDLEDPTLFIRRVQIRDDRIFGTQILTTWNAFELLPFLPQPEGVEWDISLDWLEARGLGHGTTIPYARRGFFGLPGPATGLADYWGISDSGLDNLGRGRRDLEPEADYRYRAFWQHRQRLADLYDLRAQLWSISDRNFLEQYFEREWDEMSDPVSSLELRQTLDDMSWSVLGQYQLNEFFTDTDWLPRADFFLLGKSLFGDTFTYYQHSYLGYAQFDALTPPTNPVDLRRFNYLPWELDSAGNPADLQGEVLVTRHELDLPLQLGPVKMVPYALGELAHWGEDLSGNDLQRASYQVGIRASLPLWSVNPDVESTLWNVHGIAHKVVFDVDAYLSESTRDLDELPLYNPLDDDNIEAFRRRIPDLDFGGAWFVDDFVPLRFDERYYALRSGVGSWVTSPNNEIVDDQLAVRLGMRNRWQTKRGLPGRRRIIDWITFDTGAVLFPNEDRDNFGEALGLVNYDFRWHVGDRLTLVSDALFDFFEDGQQTVSVGGFLNRPPRGSMYLGLRLMEGPISAQYVSMSYNYWMSPKWVASFGTSFNLDDLGNVGQNFRITRVGESLLVSAGFTVDSSRDNVGITMMIEPRFVPQSRLRRVSGARIGTAGAMGLE